jgi:hypothetical protein
MARLLLRGSRRPPRTRTTVFRRRNFNDGNHEAFYQRPDLSAENDSEVPSVGARHGILRGSGRRHDSLSPVGIFPETPLDQVVSLPLKGEPKASAQMRAMVAGASWYRRKRLGAFARLLELRRVHMHTETKTFHRYRSCADASCATFAFFDRAFIRRARRVGVVGVSAVFPDPSPEL